MTSVTEQIFEVLRASGLNTIFGNPGSTELPFLQNYPKDFRYILGLQEASVVGMATGHALLTDQAAMVNLHTTAGTGNAMNAIVTAWHAQAPVILTAGQQDRRQTRTEPLLWGRQAEFVRPYVKWSIEPHRAVDIPETIARAYHVAMTEPRGPVFVSICMDGLDEACPPVVPRTVSYRTAPDTVAIQEIARVLARGKRIAIVAGEQIDAAGATADVVRLAEHLQAGVFMAPIAWRWSFPPDHDLFQGHLPAAMGPLGERLAAYDTVLVIGTSVFLYYPYVPGPVVRDGTEVLHLTNDPAMASRALTGRSVIGNIALGVRQLLSLIEEGARTPPSRREQPPVSPPSTPPKPDYVHQEVSRVLPPQVIVFDEAPSSSLYLRQQGRLGEPSSYFAGASGGLGFAMPAAVGAALARPDRPVVCIVGDGSAQYSIQALWSAAQYQAPVTFIVLNNSEYGILKSFCELLHAEDVPGLDLPGINFSGLASGYGVPYRRVTRPEDVAGAVQQALASRKPALVDIPIDPLVAPLIE